MTLRVNTALNNFMNEAGSLKKALQDTVIRFYSGSLPATADLPVTGTLLGTATYQGGALTPGDKSVQQVDEYAVTYGADGNVYAIVVNGTTYSYTAIAGDNATKVATALATLVDASLVVSAVSDGNKVIARARFGGNAVTLANTGTTTPGNLVLTNLVANSRLNGLQWGSSSNGIITKEAGTWQFTAIAGGTAPGTAIGCVRICASDDANGTTPSTPRIDMDASLSAASPVVLSSLNAITGQVISVVSAAFTRTAQ